jgi:chromatin remodeling complex protein RSC6
MAVNKFMAPVKVDEALGAVVGPEPKPRTEITKKLWEYIKKNGLQDKVKKTNINADDKLKVLFEGNSQTDMFSMTRYINKHIIKG